MNYTTKTYKHLGIEERFFIESMLFNNKSIQKIAKLLQRAVSTISREIAKNTNRNGFYKAYDAQKKVKIRQMNKHAFKMLKYNEFTKHFKAIYDKKYMGVETSYNSIKKMNPNVISPTIKQIYNWINQNAWFIDRQDILRKRYRKGGNAKRNSYPKTNTKYRMPIWLRPKRINSREEFGHWEADLIIGKRAKGHANLLVLTERKTRINIISKVKSKNQYGIIKAIRRAQHDYNLPIKSITTDNGWEFKAMGLVGYHLNIKVYYCEPYASWQRGSNENANGLIRRKYPKGTDFNFISKEELAETMDQINNMPRKMFGWKSAIDMYCKELI